MGDYLCAGVNSDSDILKTKGPSIMNDKERCEIVRHCKFIDDVLPKSPYTPTLDTLKQVNCDYFAHGDDPCIDSEGVDITTKFIEHNAFKGFARTPGVSTTTLTAKLLALALHNKDADDQSSPVV
jgi:glycerol-3-phosphate cytidylyltransferase-like family protein